MQSSHENISELYNQLLKAEPSEAIWLGIRGTSPQANTLRAERANGLADEFSQRWSSDVRAAYASASSALASASEYRDDRQADAIHANVDWATGNQPGIFGLDLVQMHSGDVVAAVNDPQFAAMVTHSLGANAPAELRSQILNADGLTIGGITYRYDMPDVQTPYAHPFLGAAAHGTRLVENGDRIRTGTTGAYDPVTGTWPDWDVREYDAATHTINPSGTVEPRDALHERLSANYDLALGDARSQLRPPGGHANLAGWMFAVDPERSTPRTTEEIIALAQDYRVGKAPSSVADPGYFDRVSDYRNGVTVGRPTQKWTLGEDAHLPKRELPDVLTRFTQPFITPELENRLDGGEEIIDTSGRVLDASTHAFSPTGTVMDRRALDQILRAEQARHLRGLANGDLSKANWAVQVEATPGAPVKLDVLEPAKIDSLYRSTNLDPAQVADLLRPRPVPAPEALAAMMSGASAPAVTAEPVKAPSTQWDFRIPEPAAPVASAPSQFAFQYSSTSAPVVDPGPVPPPPGFESANSNPGPDVVAPPVREEVPAAPGPSRTARLAQAAAAIAAGVAVVTTGGTSLIATGAAIAAQDMAAGSLSERANAMTAQPAPMDPDAPVRSAGSASIRL